MTSIDHRSQLWFPNSTSYRPLSELTWTRRNSCFSALFQIDKLSSLQIELSNRNNFNWVNSRHDVSRFQVLVSIRVLFFIYRRQPNWNHFETEIQPILPEIDEFRHFFGLQNCKISKMSNPLLNWVFHVTNVSKFQFHLVFQILCLLMF